MPTTSRLDRVRHLFAQEDIDEIVAAARRVLERFDLNQILDEIRSW